MVEKWTLDCRCAGAALSTWLVATAVGAAMVGGGCDRTPDRQWLPPGSSAVHRAAARGDKDALSNELDDGEGRVDQLGPHGWTPLHFAAIYGRADAARTLLARHAQVDPVDHAGMTPLHWAARRGHLEVVRVLLAHRSQVDARNRLHMTPLHEARTPEIAAALLDRGADLNARDIDGMTPLHRAQTKRVADYLIDKRQASVNVRSHNGRTPMTMPPLVQPRVE